MSCERVQPTIHKEYTNTRLANAYHKEHNLSKHQIKKLELPTLLVWPSAAVAMDARLLPFPQRSQHPSMACTLSFDKHSQLLQPLEKSFDAHSPAHRRTSAMLASHLVVV